MHGTAGISWHAYDHSKARVQILPAMGNKSHQSKAAKGLDHMKERIFNGRSERASRRRLFKQHASTGTDRRERPLRGAGPHDGGDRTRRNGLPPRPDRIKARRRAVFLLLGPWIERASRKEACACSGTARRAPTTRGPWIASIQCRSLPARRSCRLLPWPARLKA
jgi:hypothetical protein